MSLDRNYQAFRILQIAFFVVPVLAGLDKFFYLLDDWSHYLSPFVMQLLHGHDRGFMMIVGVIEIIAGVGVLFKPKIFANIVALWLFLIIINLFMGADDFDVALRDFGLMMGALSLGRLSIQYG